MGIASEIQVAVKALLPGLTGHTQLDYEYSIDTNNDSGYEKRFGFIPGPADFVEGRSLGKTTIDHSFQLILTDDFNNQDDDTAQNTALMGLYASVEDVLKELQKSKLAVPTAGYQVLLISGLTFEEPEFSGDNSTVALRANFNIQYRYRNN